MAKQLTEQKLRQQAVRALSLISAVRGDVEI